MPSATRPGRIRLEAEVPVELAEQFREAAREADRSTRAHLRHLIREHVTTTSEAPAGNERPAKSADNGGRHDAS